MSNVDLKNTIMYMLQEHKLLLDLTKNKSTPVVTKSLQTQYFSRPLDKTIYMLLRESLSSQDTDFLQNPKKSCLRVATEFVIHSTPEKLIKLQVCCNGTDTEIREQDREQLIVLSRKLRESDYSDQQLFGDADIDNQELLDLIESIDYSLAAIPILEMLFTQIQRLYKPALQECQRLKQIVESEIEQDDEATREEIKSLTTAISLLEDGLSGKQPVVYLRTITFPSMNAVCTCGSCGNTMPAHGLLRAKSICTTPANYRQALLFANRAIIGKAQEDSANIEQIAARMGYVSPILCDKCSTINIVSDVFLMCLKEAVFTKWLDCTPVERNNDLLCTYSANIVEDVRRKYMTLCDDNYAVALREDNIAEQEIQSAQQKRFYEALPEIKYQEERNDLPAIKMTDLYSAETYTAYLAELENSLGNEKLDDPDNRKTLLLRYFLSKLFFATLGSTPADTLYSILIHPTYASYANSLTEIAKQYKEVQEQLCAATIIKNFISSGLDSTPLAGYQDQIISLSSFKACFEALHDDVFTQKLHTAGASAESLLVQYINDKTNQLESFNAEVALIGAKIYNTLLCEEARLCNQVEVNDFSDLNLVGIGTPDLVIKSGVDLTSELFSTGLATVLWEQLSPCYNTLMYQTLISKSSAIYSNYAFFNGVFAIDDGNKSVRRLLASIKNVSMSSIKINDKDALLRELLIAVCGCPSMNAISSILNITPEMLLKNHVEKLPESHDAELLNYKILLDSIGMGELSVFADGYGIEAFVSMRKQDESLSLSDGEYIALAEAAAALYCAISPFDASVQKLSAELKEYGHNAWKQSTESELDTEEVF